MNDSLLDGQTAEWRPAKQRSWTKKKFESESVRRYSGFARFADLWCLEQYLEIVSVE